MSAFYVIETDDGEICGDSYSYEESLRAIAKLRAEHPTESFRLVKEEEE